MKKIATTIFIFSMVFCWVQISNAQCVHCDTSSHATGENASVIGTGTLASGSNSFAGGLNSLAEGDYSFAFGNNNYISGESSAAFGIESQATGKCSFAMGWLSESTRNFSTVIGSKSKVNGLHSYVIGYKSEIGWGDHGYIFGSNCHLPGGNGFLIGNKLLALTDNIFIIGDGGMDTTLTNDVEHSLVVGFNSNLPTLHVGPSAGPGRTGKIGIGNVTSPSAKLHIRADAVEHAIVRIENTGSDKLAGIVFGDGSQSITTSQEMPFTFNSGGRNYSFQEGNTGFGTDDPQAKVHVKEGDIFIEDIDHGIVMKSPDGNCWRGKLNNQGQLQFAQVDCDDLMVSTPEPEPAQNAGIRIYPNPTGNRVFIETSAEWTGATLTIQNANGADLSVQKMHNTNSFIDMTSFETGVYIFRITTADSQKVISEKVIKN